MQDQTILDFYSEAKENTPLCNEPGCGDRQPMKLQSVWVTKPDEDLGRMKAELEEEEYHPYVNFSRTYVCEECNAMYSPPRKRIRL